MTETSKFRAPTADGRMMYPIDDHEFGGPEWITPVDFVASSGKFRAPRLAIVAADVTELEYRTRLRQDVVGYKRNGTNEAFPENLTVEGWEDFRTSIGYDDDNEVWLADRLYERVYGEQRYTTGTIDLSGYADLPADVLDPASLIDADPTFDWEVAAPYLVFGSVYASAMPGALTSVRERLAKAVEARVPQANIWTHKANSDGVVDGSVKLRFEDNRTYPVKEGRRTTQRTSTRDYRFSFPIPRAIVAPSKAEAIAKFDALVTEIATSIESSEFVACAHCDGEGVVGK